MPKKLNVPLGFSPTFTAGGDVPERLHLSYELMPAKEVRLVQQRLKNRWFYVPEISLADYTVEAKVDWVEFRVRLCRSSQAIHVGKKLSSPRASVYAYDRSEADRLAAEGPHSFPLNTDTFWIRIQDPNPWSIGSAKDVLHETWSIAGEISISAVEVAVDWKPKDHSDLKRYQMVATLFRHHLPLPFDHEVAEDDMRQVHGPKPEFAFPSIGNQKRDYPDTDVRRPEVQKRLLRDDTIFEHYLNASVYRGARLAPRSFKIYDKCTDGRDDSRETVTYLPQEGKCARIEVTLRGQALAEYGLEGLEDLQGFKFDDLSKLFTFRFATERGNPLHSANPLMGDPYRNLFRRGGVYLVHYYHQALKAHMQRPIGQSGGNYGMEGTERPGTQRFAHPQPAMEGMTYEGGSEVSDV